MITVRVWGATVDNVGHASAMVGRTYVSWWPGTDDWMALAKGAKNTLKADLKAEGGRPQHMFRLNTLDETAALRWWNAFTSGANANYSATGQNCSWAVMNVLKKAGGDAYVGFSTRNNVISLNNYWCTYQTTRAIAVKAGVATASAKEAVVYADNCMSTWTPPDVARYCEQLQRGLAAR